MPAIFDSAPYALTVRRYAAVLMYVPICLSPLAPRWVAAQSPAGAGQAPPPPLSSVSAAMDGPLVEMAHMRMTAIARPAAGDSARAAALVTTLRTALAPYADYHRALDDGFHIFAPRVPQRVYHFTSRRRAFWSTLRFDPAAPSSLLYEKTGDSTYRLVGAMYTAPRHATLAALNARVPLSVVQWHVHTNWCVPMHGGAVENRSRGPDGKPLFGAQGSITTRTACKAAGGWFFPQVFGWMVHVYPFATDPAQIWGTHDMHDM